MIEFDQVINKIIFFETRIRQRLKMYLFLNNNINWSK